MGLAMKMTGMTALQSAFVPIAASSRNVAVQATADHAEFVEYGTSRHRAQPFARPGTNKAMVSFAELEARASNLSALVMLLAQRIAHEWRKNVPVDSGELKDSIEVVSE